MISAWKKSVESGVALEIDLCELVGLLAARDEVVEQLLLVVTRSGTRFGIVDSRVMVVEATSNRIKRIAEQFQETTLHLGPFEDQFRSA